jgi:dsDNA-specific endonuclease/ATPase MutS2
VRIVHGKGIGDLKRSVHAILTRHPDVLSFSEAGAHFGGSGATVVNLRASGSA